MATQASKRKLKPAEFKDKRYLSWLHEKNCLVCGYHPVEAHHIKHHSIIGRSDNYTIPLCKRHHTGLVIHEKGEELFYAHDTKRFNEVYPIDFQKELAEKLYNEYQEGLS